MFYVEQSCSCSNLILEHRYNFILRRMELSGSIIYTCVCVCDLCGCVCVCVHALACVCVCIKYRNIFLRIYIYEIPICET